MPELISTIADSRVTHLLADGSSQAHALTSGFQFGIAIAAAIAAVNLIVALISPRIAPDAGQVVLSVPSPEALRREGDVVRQVIDAAGTSTEPIVIVVEAEVSPVTASVHASPLLAAPTR